MDDEHREMSQAEFARDCGVSRAAVSQWKANDILREDAFTGEGKTGKLIYHIAMEQVRRNRDIGQSLGNGIGTRTTAGDAALMSAPPDPQAALPLEAAPAADAPSARAAAARPDTVEDQLKRAKLEEQLRRNRIQAAEEAAQQGLLMAAGDAREQMSRIAVMMVQIFEGALPDFASAMAARYNLPQRDVLHLLRAEFVKVRASAAAKERMRAGTEQKSVTASVEMEG